MSCHNRVTTSVRLLKKKPTEDVSQIAARGEREIRCTRPLLRSCTQIGDGGHVNRGKYNYRSGTRYLKTILFIGAPILMGTLNDR